MTSLPCSNDTAKRCWRASLWGRDSRQSALLCALLAGAMLIAGLLPVTARAAIVPGLGIARVNIGTSMGHVRTVLGDPNDVKPPTWGYGNPLRGRIGFDHGRRVNDIWTTSPAQKTKRGIGPGSSFRQMRQRYPSARCHGARDRLCLFAVHRGDGTVKTAFVFHGRLRRVEIYLVPPSSGTPVPK